MAIRLVLIGGDAWRESASPWLDGVEAWRDERPTVVLTPDRAQGFYLRSRLVAEGKSLIGVRFWTPSDARGFLQGVLRPNLRAATQNEQALIARACAEKLLRGRAGTDEATLRSVAQDPEPFRRAYDLLLGAGWNPGQDGVAYGQRLAREFQATLAKAGLTTQAGLHRELREAQPPKRKPIARILIANFNAAHWPLWDLLQAVCLMADDAEIALEHPGEFGKQLDELWTGSWESFARTVYEPGEHEGAEPGPLTPLAASYEAGVPTPCPEAEVHFLATSELTEQVRAVTLQALDYLRQPDCARLGIVFPQGDALALGVAEQLRALKIPMNDTLGALQPGPCESRLWQTWLELQEEATVRRLIAWLRACDALRLEVGLGAVTVDEAASMIDRALGNSMVDHLDFLAAQLDGKEGRPRTVANFLRHRIRLPEEGTVAEFLTESRKALEVLKWEDIPGYLPEQVPQGTGDLRISRRAFLAWLREASASGERVRPEGNYFYGKVHLITYRQIAGQEWTHLVLTGLNEGVWPRLTETGAFGSRHDLAELNERARALNRRGERTGEQGEGQWIVEGGHAHALLPMESHALALRDLCGALRATRGAICLAARSQDQGRNMLPSDFFSHAWQVKTGGILNETAFRELARKTAQRCGEHATFFAPRPVEPQEIGATKSAYEARMNPEIPFGPYQFAFRKVPESPIELWCKEWEAALGDPAGTWLAKIVGAEVWPEGNLGWKMSQGTWIHRWLSSALGPGMTPANVEQRVQAAAERDQEAIEKRARDTNVALYPWWRQLWSQSAGTARALARRLVPELAGKSVLAEFTLPKPLKMALPGESRADFTAKGRLDLVLVNSMPDLEADAPRFTGVRAWVIDFKTGSDKGLTASNLKKGHGVQIALYGLALRQLGAEAVTMSVATRDRTLKAELTDEKVIGLDEPFRKLTAMYQKGVFGESAEDREHGHAPTYPMTTRPVPRETLQAKWELENGGEGA